MYGNVGDKYILVKEIDKIGLILNDIGSEYEIQEYYSVPHGYTSIKHNGILLFIPDELFNKGFVKSEQYSRYKREGSVLYVNANGNLREYEIDTINSDDKAHYVTLHLKAID
jgi:hypothetical protein